MARPNIILILLDDSPVDFPARMTNWNTYSNQQVRFANSLLCTPLCTPSRCTIWSGRHPINHGIIKNEDAELFDFQTALPKALMNAGYHTCHIGKVLNGWPFAPAAVPNPPGFEESYSFHMSNNNQSDYRNYKLVENGVLVTYGGTDADYSTDVFTNKAVDYINRAPDGIPFFLQVSNFAPHATQELSSTYPATRHQTLYNTENRVATRRESFNEDNIIDKPEWLSTHFPSLMTAGTQTNADTYRYDAYRCIAAVDEQFLAIHDALVSNGFWTNTVIIVMTDNGNCFGEHRLWRSGRGGTKGFPYEEAIKANIQIRLPNFTLGRIDNGIVSNMDIAPTICEFAHAKMKYAMQGMSLVPRLYSPGQAFRGTQYIAGRRESDDELCDPWDGIRSSELKYVEYLETDELEYYRDIEDYGASEMVSLAYQNDMTSYAARLAGLKAALHPTVP